MEPSILAPRKAARKIVASLPIDNLVIFDLETTGLSPTANDIIQIAAVRVTGEGVRHTEAFSTFVNPGYRIPAFIVQYTGITDAQVAPAPGIAEALAAFARFAGNGVLVAHNGRRFDTPFVAAACRKAGLRTRPAVYSDSIYLSKQMWPGVRGHAMDAMLSRLRLNTAGFRRHDARGDTGLLAEAVFHMWRALAPGCATLPVPTFEGVLPE
jgi:DNA polymerase III alpha subunit (gram-positive type)